MGDELEHIWSRVQAELALAVDEPTYRIWLGSLRACSFDGGRLSIAAPEHACGWIRGRFGPLLESSVRSVLGADVVIELIAGDDLGEELAQAPPAGGPPGANHDQASLGLRRALGSERHRLGHRQQRAGLDLDALGGPLGNPKLTFDQFVIGDSNRLAHAAALTVAEMPAQAYNPLFICGPPGLGKTHLLSSIASLLLCHSPGLTVRCTTGETFTNEFLNALGDGHTDGFKARFRHVDVLLLDDVQFFERKTKTEEEFFHTFNALHDGGRQIVLTSDRPPHDLQALEDRLRERFAAGLGAEIEPPDRATRLAILRKRAHHDHLELPDEAALEVVAERVATNVRALEGALIRIVAFSSLTGRPLTGELAREVLSRLYPHASPAGCQHAHSVNEIQSAACEQFGLSSKELLSTSRTARIAWPRQVAMYLARELTGESLPAIGRHFGGRDHTTVLHAWRRTTTRISEDPSARDAVENLRRSLDRKRP